MLRLLTFGGVRVVRGDGSATDLANQRRRIAVLTAVAAAAPGGVSRERLQLLLWPDADGERGRHALNQIVYNLRRELGESPIDGALELSLLPDVMSADLIDFRGAVARGDHEAVVDLYAGQFLDHFFVPGATEFDRWADAERERTRRQVITSLERLASASADAAEWDAHARWTARLVELDPLSARRVLAHMRAMEVLGDRDAAIAYGRRYDALARADGDDVDASVTAEVDRLRALPAMVPPMLRADTGATGAVGDGVPAERADSPEAMRELCAVEATPDVTPPSASPALLVDPSTTTVRHPRWGRSMAVGAALMVCTLIAWTRLQQPALPLAAGDRLLLADVQLPPSDSADARGMTIALQSALQQSARVQIVSPVSVREGLRRMSRGTVVALPDSVALELAEREGVRYVASLSVLPQGGKRLVTLRVLDPIAHTTIRTYTAGAPSAELLSAIDAVAAKLRHDIGDSRRDIATAIPLPYATTPSLEALRLLASARTAFNRSLYADARALYASAVALDSGFAAAHAGLAAIAYLYNDIPAGDAQIARALALADRLPPRERMLIEAEAARGRADWSQAATLHRAYLLRYPLDYDLYGALAYDLMMDRSYGDALAAFDTLRAHRPPDANSLFNRGQVQVALRRYADARMSHTAAVHLDTAMLLRSVQNEQIGSNLVRLGALDSARAVFGLLLTRDESDRARAHRSLAYVDLFDGRYAAALLHMRTAVEISQSVRGASLSEIRDRALLASILLDLGNAEAAREQVRAAAQLCIRAPHDPRALFWTGKPAARLGDTATARLLLDSARARTRASDRSQTAATLGLEAELQVAHGRFADAVATARRAIAADSVTYLVETLATALEHDGQLAEARAQQVALDRGHLAAVGREGQQAARLAPLALARLELRLGDRAAATARLTAFARHWPRADANLPMLNAVRADLAVPAR